MMLVMNLALISGIAALMAAAAGNSSMARLLRQSRLEPPGHCRHYWVVPIEVVSVVGEPHHHGRGYATLAAGRFEEGARLESRDRPRD